jgi:hypothetical protein
MIKKLNPKASKLTLTKETLRGLSHDELGQVAGAGSGYGSCRNNATMLCSVGGGRGNCTLFLVDESGGLE